MFKNTAHLYHILLHAIFNVQMDGNNVLEKYRQGKLHAHAQAQTAS